MGDVQIMYIRIISDKTKQGDVGGYSDFLILTTRITGAQVPLYSSSDTEMYLKVEISCPLLNVPYSSPIIHEDLCVC